MSKLAGEEVVRTYSKDFGIKSIVIRAPFIAGENQKEKNVLRKFIECVISGKSLIILGDGKHIREFVRPRNLADAFVRSVKYLDGQEVSELFVVGNKGIAIRDLAHMVVAHVGRGKWSFRKVQPQRSISTVIFPRLSGFCIGASELRRFSRKQLTRTVLIASNLSTLVTIRMILLRLSPSRVSLGLILLFNWLRCTNLSEGVSSFFILLRDFS